jgi:hypothetical protein
MVIEGIGRRLRLAVVGGGPGYLFPYRVGCSISPTSLAIPAYGAVPRETAPVASPPHGCWQPS